MLQRAIAWIAKYGDELAAIALALAVAALAWDDAVGSTAVSNTILLVLAAITTSNLRDRFRNKAMHTELLASLEGRAESLEKSIEGRAEFLQRSIEERAEFLERSNEAQTAVLREQTVALRKAVDDAAQVQVLTGEQVGTALASARVGTKVWLFRGGTGTYLRAKTLPQCTDDARQYKRRLEVKIQIIDPTNVDLCTLYARFRTTLAPGADSTGKAWTLDRTRAEAYATILAACWYRQNNDLLDISVGLSNTMSTFRWDMSSSAVIVTQEDAAGQALRFTSDRTYYVYMENELRNAFAQTRIVPLTQADSISLSNKRVPSVDEVRALFVALGLDLPTSFDERFISNVVTLAIEPDNPYER